MGWCAMRWCDVRRDGMRWNGMGRDGMRCGAEAYECGECPWIWMDMDGCAVVPMAAAGPSTRIQSEYRRRQTQMNLCLMAGLLYYFLPPSPLPHRIVVLCRCQYWAWLLNDTLCDFQHVHWPPTTGSSSSSSARRARVGPSSHFKPNSKGSQKGRRPGPSVRPIRRAASYMAWKSFCSTSSTWADCNCEKRRLWDGCWEVGSTSARGGGWAIVKGGGQLFGSNSAAAEVEILWIEGL